MDEYLLNEDEMSLKDKPYNRMDEGTLQHDGRAS
jgi:hypothetical protein